MNLPTIKTSVDKNDAESLRPSTQQVDPERLDPAFLQLLASLGLTPQALTSDSMPNNGDNPFGMAWEKSLVDVYQQSITSAIQVDSSTQLSGDGLQANSGNVTVASMIKSLLAERSADHNNEQTPKPLSAKDQHQSTGAEEPIIAGIKPQDNTWTSDVNRTGSSSRLSSVDPKLDVAVIAKPTEHRLTDHSHIDHGSISRVSSPDPSFKNAQSNAVAQTLSPNDFVGKDASSSEHVLMWRAALDGEEMAANGKEKHSDWSDRQVGKVLSSDTSSGMNKTILPHAMPPVSPPSEPVAVRSVSAAAPIQNVLPNAFEFPTSPSVRFEVHPDELGSVRVHLSVVDHTVYTNVMTDRVEAHDFLVRNSDRFEAGLAAHGLDVGRFQVDVQSQGRDQRDGAAWTRSEGQRQADHLSSGQSESEPHRRERALIDWDKQMVSLFA